MQCSSLRCLRFSCLVLRVWITSHFAHRRFDVACLNVQADANCPVLAAVDLFLAAIDSYRAIFQQDTGILHPLAFAGINVAVMVQLAIQANHIHICHVLVLTDHDIWLVVNIIDHAVAANGFTGQDLLVLGPFALFVVHVSVDHGILVKRFVSI